MRESLYNFYIKNMGNTNCDINLLFNDYFDDNHWSSEFNYTMWDDELYKLQSYIIKKSDTENIQMFCPFDSKISAWLSSLIEYIEDNVPVNKSLESKMWLINNFTYILQEKYDNEYWNAVVELYYKPKKIKYNYNIEDFNILFLMLSTLSLIALIILII